MKSALLALPLFLATSIATSVAFSAPAPAQEVMATCHIEQLEGEGLSQVGAKKVLFSGEVAVDKYIVTTKDGEVTTVESLEDVDFANTQVNFVSIQGNVILVGSVQKLIVAAGVGSATLFDLQSRIAMTCRNS